ncbi:hypothetical protein [Actinoplanes rectilineatus]|uniref:hypothetical protein n=1 Tax=Actinoplanes rectilineatus TaxID=113571 RepID=UPI0005F2B6AD|nr:hypothetical protein [Actinoplanes rectilineatus]
MTVTVYRKKPVEVRTVQWTGDNADELVQFTGNRFGVLDPQDRAECADPEATAQVLDVLHSTWVLVYIGDSIVEGVQGEFYPIRASVLADTYEPVPADAANDH